MFLAKRAPRYNSSAAVGRTTSYVRVIIHLVPLSSVIVPGPAPMRVVSGRNRARNASQMTHITARARLRKSNIARAHHPWLPCDPDPPFAVLFIEGRKEGTHRATVINMYQDNKEGEGADEERENEGKMRGTKRKSGRASCCTGRGGERVGGIVDAIVQ